jgi:hypothetical protein
MQSKTFVIPRQSSGAQKQKPFRHCWPEITRPHEAYAKHRTNSAPAITTILRLRGSVAAD